MLFVLPREMERNPLVALGLLFPAIGVGLLVWALRMTARWRRFGPATFELAGAPAAPGGSCHGTIYVPVDVSRPHHDLTAGVTLKLTSVKRVVARGDDDTRETIEWQEEQYVRGDLIALTASGAAIPVHFDIPDGAQETTSIDGSSGTVWVLSAASPRTSVNFAEEFEVPVYRAAGTPQARPVVSRSASAAAEPVTLAHLAASGIHVRPTPEGVEYVFGPARNASLAIGFTAFTLIWTGALWVQRTLEFPLIFQVLTALVDVVLVLFALDLWLGQTRVTIGPGLVRRRHAILGLGSTRTIPSPDIMDVRLDITMQQNSGRSGTPYYELKALLKNGRRRSLGGGVRDKRQAEWLAAQMRSAIGLGGPPS
jgi:hypothetical protein